MKKIVAIALIVVLVFAMASVAFAADNVISPEKGNTNPSVTPAPGKTSPQTGESFSALWVLLTAILLLAVAVFCGAKLVKVK